MNKTPLILPHSANPLFAQVSGYDALPAADGEEAWIEVIQQMDRVYAELIESQVALEKKNAELEQAQEFISSVMRSMTDLLIVCGPDGKIVQVNDALEQLTGLDAPALIDQHFSLILTDNNTGNLSQLIRHAQANKPFSDCEIMVADLQGEMVPISINGSPRYDNKGRLVGLVLIGRPVGELQRAYRELDAALKNIDLAQQQLIGAEKMASLGRLVAGVAHEMNNPISFVFGNMYALKSYGEKITRYLKAIDSDMAPETLESLRIELQIDRIADDILPLVDGTLEGAERVRDIVQELRQFSGTQTEPAAEFNLRDVIETAINWVIRGAKHHPDVTIECDQELKLNSRKGHIHQIIVNLMQNAIDAMDNCDQAKVVITCTQSNVETAISIADNGEGIAPQNIEHIFEPFFTTKPVGEGTGLGLYVSYRLAEEIGAKLNAKTDSESGAEMVISIPKVIQVSA